MYCRACYTNLPDSATTCRKCGRDPRAVPSALPGAPQSPARPEAGGSHRSERPEGQETPVEPPPGPSPRSKLLKAAGVGLAVALVLSAALLLVRPRPDRIGSPGGDAPAGTAERLAAAPIDLEPPDMPEPVDEAALGPAAAIYGEASEAYRTGDPARALGLLREADGAAPGEPMIEAALASVLEALAAERLRVGAFAEAETLLAEAVARDGTRGEAWKALGYSQLRQERVAEAMASLAEAARLVPEDAQTHLLYGTALYRAGDTQGALAELRAGRPAGAGDAAFEALLATVEREAEAERGHAKAESRHFTVSFEGGGTSEQAGYLVSLLLEDAYHKVGVQLDYYPAEPVHAVLYPAEQFRDVTRSPAWAGALFDGKIRLPVGGLTDRTEALSRTIAHEYTHALVHRLARGRAPVWLNEGLAQLAEGPFEGPVRDRFRAYVRGGGRVQDLRALEGSFVRLDAAQAELAYVQSLAATDFLVTRYGPATSRRLLDRLGAGEPLATAIEALLYVPYEDLERQWIESYR